MLHKKLNVCRITKIILPLVLMTNLHMGLADDTHQSEKNLIPVIVLDFELLGDATVASMKQHDAVLMNQFSNELRKQLNEQQIFSVLDDKQSLATINQASQNHFLHRCNGCELDLAKKLGAEQVIVPWVFRMSKLIQTMFVEIRDVKTGRILLHKGRNFRGNTQKGWEHVTASLLRAIKLDVQNNKQH